MDSLISSQPINEDVSNIESIRKNLDASIDKLKKAENVEEYQSQCTVLSLLLGSLDNIHMSLGNLRVTQIGKYITKLESRLPPHLSIQAKNLNNKWRDVVLQYRQLVKKNLATRIGSGDNMIKNAPEKNPEPRTSLLATELNTVQKLNQKLVSTISLQDTDVIIVQNPNQVKSKITIPEHPTEHQNCYKIFSESDVNDIKIVMSNTINKINTIESDVANIKKVILDLNSKLFNIFEKFDKSAITRQTNILSLDANLNLKTDCLEVPTSKASHNVQYISPGIDVQNKVSNYNYKNNDFLIPSNSKTEVFDEKFDKVNRHSLSTQKTFNDIKQATFNKEINNLKDSPDKIHLKNIEIDCDRVNGPENVNKVVIKIEDDEDPINEFSGFNNSRKVEVCEISKTTYNPLSNQSLSSVPPQSFSNLNGIFNQSVINKSMSVNLSPSFSSISSKTLPPTVSSAHQTLSNSSLPLLEKKYSKETNCRSIQLTSPLPLYGSHSSKLNQCNKILSSSKFIATEKKSMSNVFKVPQTMMHPVIQSANTEVILKTATPLQEANNVLLDGNLSIQDVELEPFLSFSQAVDNMGDELEGEDRSYLLNNAKKNRGTWNKICKSNEGMRYALLVKSKGRMKAVHKASLGKDAIHRIVKKKIRKINKKFS
ncbi:uncharacterized protein LOC105844411 isoform X1 [Hydra vulgaris]|uniref:uncharacterized protein LOC105844411 isoform X1 n=1 Tax=Hydra vulgaris TaxID=6087 RepID=UPI000640E432|nr:uncharacterized protein LOC105844411 [Hydra vulgaris]XP_047136954.1 uncharacterized protein LOC105844411 [Hydra vulgaris]XP_047136955.1 uncharacterized protein LOC105844411 [Hydra vulgaris]